MDEDGDEEAADAVLHPTRAEKGSQVSGIVFMGSEEQGIGRDVVPLPLKNCVKPKDEQSQGFMKNRLRLTLLGNGLVLQKDLHHVRELESLATILLHVDTDVPERKTDIVCLSNSK